MVNTAIGPFSDPGANSTSSSLSALPYAGDSSTALSSMISSTADLYVDQVGSSGYSAGALLDDESECVEAGLVEYCPVDNAPAHSSSNLIENVLSSYIGPRVVLAMVAILYGTNFPLGAIMNDNLPASAATSSRMVLASLVLFPFLLKLKPSLRTQVLIGGSFVSMGYVSQSIALIDTSPALVSFLGSATVIVCPILQWLVDKKPMGIKDAPQTWMVSDSCTILWWCFAHLLTANEMMLYQSSIHNAPTHQLQMHTLYSLQLITSQISRNIGCFSMPIRCGCVGVD